MTPNPPQIHHSFLLPVRVYYEDTDAGGVVYHSNYLNYMERARTEWLSALGFEQDWIASELGVLFVVHSLQLSYLKPARFNDRLQVETGIRQWGSSSILFAQDIWRVAKKEQGTVVEKEHLVKGEVRVVCIKQQNFRPTAIPNLIKDAFRDD
ncbi:MAG: tol-pal system-associated acyl-CoA thioesterase [Thiothrix sp.]|nr:tol-pal system-associated acyl-CoA thioesterase [Thiothrix sp.]HPQ96244.1 tol-pal system-associated acyl-CoA thioesterase [Thiolinea sp.]